MFVSLACRTRKFLFFFKKKITQQANKLYCLKILDFIIFCMLQLIFHPNDFDRDILNETFKEMDSKANKN